MPIAKDLEVQLETLHSEVQAAWQDAEARLAGARRVKLGDLNLREDLYRELQSIFRQLYHHRRLRRAFFRSDQTGCQSRFLLLTFMSELVYWEYERSFWNKLYEVLELKSKQSAYRWFTSQMTHGYAENDIPLIRSRYSWGERREYVRTIISESGFSRPLMQQAKRFVIWFFDHHSNLDPRTLDRESFDRILDESGFIWDKEEIFELLRDMLGAVSRLLREIRKRSLTSDDLRDPTILNELQEALGFHPIRGIFGFRKEEDIQELLETISKRVKPRTFYNMLHRKTRSSRDSLSIITPEGQSIVIRSAREIPIIFGEYQLLDPRPSMVQVVPREALTLRRVAKMLQSSKRVFHQDGPAYAWIHDDEPFEVYQGSIEPEESRPYYLEGLKGHLWYGKQKIGMPLRAERDGQALSDLDPRRDIWLNPRLRLSHNKMGLEVVIPSFVCYEPEFAGHTVRLELNGRAIEDTTYVIGRDGSLQFQATRVAQVLPDDEKLKVSLVALDSGKSVTSNSVPYSVEKGLLFSRGNRERVRSGHQHYGGDRFILFAEKGARISLGDALEIEDSSEFGPFQVRHLRWTPDPSDPKPFALKVGDQSWQFTCPIQVSAQLFCSQPENHFRPKEPNSAFDPSYIQIRIYLQGHPDEVAEVRPKLSLIIEKDDEFLTSFSLTELERLNYLQVCSPQNELSIDTAQVIDYLVGQRLTDRQIGSYRWALMIQPSPLDDLEQISEMAFMLLPNLDAKKLDIPMTEGEESLITVLCDAPLLADTNDRPTNALQLGCVPRARFDTRSARLKALQIERLVRLIYPPTKVDLRFVPQLFAIRLVYDNKAQPRSRLAYSEARTSHLTVMTPPNETVSIVGNGTSDSIKTDNEGQACYQLARLLSTIQGQKTKFYVTWKDFQHRFEIVWHPSLQFDHEHCFLDTASEERSSLVLNFSAEGPPTVEITFSLSDNRFRSHGEHCVNLANLTQGTLEFPIDNSVVEGASVIFCAARAGRNQLDTTRIQLRDDRGDEIEQLAQQLKVDLESASLEELPERIRMLENTGQPPLVEQALHHMYSVQRLDQVYEKRKKGKMGQRDVTAFFRWFTPSMLPDIRQMDIPKLKRYHSIPEPKLQAACAEGLLLQEDGYGVDQTVELMAQGIISWEEGFEILSKNKECASEVIRDMVRWDELEREEDDYIELMERLSREFHPALARRARAAKDWKKALALSKSGQIIDAEAVNWDESGLIVPIGLIAGRVPIEELDTKRHDLKGNRGAIRRRLYRIVGKPLKLVVVDVDRSSERLILSEKKARSKLARELIQQLSEGETQTGTVTNLCDFGAFVDLGGVDGLIHVSELSWEKIGHPSEVLAVDDEIQVYILDVDLEKCQVSLSLKKLLPDPWLKKAQKYKIGQNVQGYVTEVTDFGAFVSIEPEVDGFAHISELSHEHIFHPNQVVHKGDRLTLRVLRIDEEKQRLILSLKQVGEGDLYWGSFRIKQ